MFLASKSSSVSVLDESEAPRQTTECAVVDELAGNTDGVRGVELETVSSLNETDTRDGVTNNGNSSVNGVGDDVGFKADVGDRFSKAAFATSTERTWE